MTPSWLFLFMALLGVYHVAAQTNGDFRLEGTGSTKGQGRVRIYYDGTWYSVCVSLFAVQGGNVMCKELGFTTHSFVILNDQTLFPPKPAASVPQKSITCKGAESKVRQCAIADATNTAICPTDHSKDLLLRCTGTLPGGTTTTAKPDFGTLPPVTCNTASNVVRLVGGPSKTEGRVEVKYNTEWGAVCDDGWGRPDATVVCRMLCSTAGQAVAMTGMYTSGVKKILLTNLGCTGSETDLSKCPHDGWNNNNCKLSEVASVRCAPPTVKPPTYPTASLQCSMTKMTITFDVSKHPNVTPTHIRLLKPVANCGFDVQTDKTNNKHIIATVPLNACGTKMTENATHITYENNLVQTVPDIGQVVNFVQDYEMPFRCATPKDVIVPPKPIETILIKLPPSYSQLSMNTSMRFFDTNGKPITNGQIQLGSNFLVEVDAPTSDPNLKMILKKCYAQAGQSAVTYDLIVNKCPADPSVVVQPIGPRTVAFSVKAFQFKNNKNAQIYIHCEVTVCPIKSKTSECDQTCGTRRRKRDVISRSPAQSAVQSSSSEGITMVAPEGDDWVIVDLGVIIRYVKKTKSTPSTTTTTTTTAITMTTSEMVIDTDRPTTEGKSIVVSTVSVTGTEQQVGNSKPADMFIDDVIKVQGGEANSAASGSILSMFSLVASLVVMAMTYVIR